MTTSTYKKYSSILDIYEKSDYDTVLIKANDKLPILSPNLGEAEYARDLGIIAISAKHNDLLSDRDSIGFVIHYKDFVLVYTGDTGFSREMEKQYRNIHKKYSKYNIVLLAHIGGFKEYEKKFDASSSINENYRFFYKNHLGRLGLAKLVEIVKPKICIISEFGEEFRKTRLKLTQIFQDVYGDDTFFIPADIGLCLNTANEIKLIDKIDYDKTKVHDAFYPYYDTAICEHKLNTSLQYYKKGAVTEADLREFLSNMPNRNY